METRMDGTADDGAAMSGRVPSAVPVSSRRTGRARCPVCGKPADAATRPFCSTRCADVDLGRWLTGQYRIPGAADRRGRRTSLPRDFGIAGPGRRLDRAAGILYGTRALQRLPCAQVAQLVEHATENRSVGGSIPPLGTIPSSASASFCLRTYAATLLSS